MIERLLEEHPALAEEIKGTLRAHVHLRDLTGRTNQGEVIEADTEQQVAEKLQSHIDSLHHMLLPWALRSAAPEGVDHAAWGAALEQAIRALFSTTT